MEYNVILCYICVLFCLILQSNVLEATVPEYFIDEHCSQTLSLNYGSVEALRLRLAKTLTYPDGMRCAMRIQAPEGKKLVVRIEKIDITGSQDSSCQDGDYLQFFDGPSESAISHPDLPSNLCSKPEVGHFSTSGRYLVLRFISNTDLVTGSGVKLTVTAYSETPCGPDEFQCKTSAHCIKSSLRCNEHPSCPDGTDEIMPDCLSTAAIAGIIVGCVLVFAAVVIAIVVLCVMRERRKRARIIKMNYNNGVTKISKPQNQSATKPKANSGTNNKSSQQNGRSSKRQSQSRSKSTLHQQSNTISSLSGQNGLPSTTLPRPSKSAAVKSSKKQSRATNTLPRPGNTTKSTQKRHGVAEFPEILGLRNCPHKGNHSDDTSEHYDTSPGFCNECFIMEPEIINKMLLSQLHEDLVSLSMSESSKVTHKSQPLEEDAHEDDTYTDSDFTDSFSDQNDNGEELTTKLPKQTHGINNAFLRPPVPGSSNASVCSGTSYQCLWKSGSDAPLTSKPLKAGEFRVQYNKYTQEFDTVRKESVL